ncbi:hypothetical protein SAMN05421820_101715 [Pedobacter steynii]|uniref:Uncharacterized protein n=1 Tax=Pedobacter steynii TaxID=430522 RepID=A0A1G9KZV1_9SPHI|nr:hypothetical protein [Pedobacter steynii]NQX38684.1 hypothetical protein [Pedobacter steynii]SDL55074.1 hypothetical protein SAMN05421820_101715 [Pedobacter steynii]
MKEEILNEIKRLGGNTDNVKGISLQEDLAAIAFKHPLYPDHYGDELYGTDQFYEENKQLYKDDKQSFYQKLMAHFFSDHEIPYGQAFFRNSLFTPFSKGTFDFEEWNDMFVDEDEVNLTEIRKVSTDPSPDFMVIASSYGFPDQYYISLSDQNQENPTVFGTDHEVFFSEITNEGSLSDFFKRFLSKEDFLKIVENYIENEKTDK